MCRTARSPGPGAPEPPDRAPSAAVVDGLGPVLINGYATTQGAPATALLQEEVEPGIGGSVHPDDRSGYIEKYLEHFKKCQPFQTEYRLRRHDGVGEARHQH